MDSKLFVTCVRRLHSVQIVYLTFRLGQEGNVGLRQFVSLVESTPGILAVEPGLFHLKRTLRSGPLENVRRTVIVYGLAHADPGLLEQIAPGLDHIASVQHRASRLFTSSPSVRLVVADAILELILEPNLVYEIWGWGVGISGNFKEIDGLPAVVFDLYDQHDGKDLLKIAIDGWSGRIGVNGTWGDRMAGSPDELQRLILSALVGRLDAMTAPGQPVSQVAR